MSTSPSPHASAPLNDRDSVGNIKARLIASWLFVGTPLLYGVIQTVRRAAALFTGCASSPALATAGRRPGQAGSRVVTAPFAVS